MATYKGTGVTGASTSGKVFKGSGVRYAHANIDVYVNSVTGCRYKCVKDGNANTAQWAYVSTDVLYKPGLKVTDLKVKRSGTTFTATWKVPKEATDAKRNDRADSVTLYDTLWYYSGPNMIREQDGPVRWDRPLATKTWVQDMNPFQCREKYYVGRVAYFKNLYRSDFYPYDGKPKLKKYRIRVALDNAKGAGQYAEKELVFDQPNAPKISAPAFDVDTGTVSVTVTAAKDEGAKERLWTVGEVHVTDTSVSAQSRRTAYGQSTAASFTLSYDAVNYQSLLAGQYIKVEFRAWSQGFMGDSAVKKSTYYVSFPKPVIIPNSSDRRVKVTARDSSGKVIVPVTVTKEAAFPVDSIKLQKLANVAYPTPGSIPGDAEWTDAGPTDDGDCTALVAQVADLMPEAGKHSYVRVKAWHGSEESLYSYSRAVEVPLYEEPPSAHDDECEITSLVPGDDGESLECVVAWDSKASSGDDDATGVELSWSDYAGAWRSTSQPQTFDVEWTDETVDPSASASWNKSAHVTIRGLSEGQAYHVRARCYLATADARTYGPHCDEAVAQTRSEPPSAVLRAPTSVAPGEGVALSWELASAAPQASWMVLARKQSKDYVVAEGTGTAGSCTVAASAVASRKDGDALVLFVRCSTGSEFVESGTATVLVAVPPTLAVTASTATSQPASFAVACDQDGVEVSYSVTADGGSTGDAEVGVRPQPDGDVVAAGTARPSLTKSGGLYRGTVDLVDGLDLRDGCSYSVRATARAANGLESDPAEAAFPVAWSHQAPEPPGDAYAPTSDAEPVEGKRYYVPDGEGGYLQADPVDPSEMSAYYEDTGISVEPYEEDGESGVERGCRIFLNPPSGAASDDLYDVYRLTHDGPELAYGGAPLQCVLKDPLAPYGDAGDFAYRIACRTSDGDMAWADYSYALECRMLRVDWPTGHVELPYDIGISDGYEKDVEVQRRMDGSDVALYGPGHARTASLSTNVLRVEDPETATALRELARHAGTCWVRTPDGSAYEADVQVRSMEVGAQVAAVALEARRVTATGAYDIPSPDDEEEE